MAHMYRYPLQTIKDGREDLLNDWLEAGGDPNLGIVGDYGVYRGRLLHSVWHFASRAPANVRSRMIRLLVGHGADVNVRDTTGRSPLQLCLSPEDASALLEAGADIHARDHRAHTPLMDAVATLRLGAAVPLLRVFLKYGADVDDVLSIGARDLEGRLLVENVGYISKGLYEFLVAIKAAGGWKKYVKAPRIALVRLRLLCARGRAVPPADPVLARLFAAPPSPTTTKLPRTSQQPIPNECFWHILSYWRTGRETGDASELETW